jgi:photosystem II stability/assembly factor-like uncharacterized protein
MIYSAKSSCSVGKVLISGLFVLVLIMLSVNPGSAFVAERPAFMMPLAAKTLVLDIATPGTGIVAVGWRGHILLSDDEAQTWHQVVSPTCSMLNSVFFIDDLRGWAVGNDAVIISTEDGGKSWQLLHSAPEEERPLYDLFVTGDYGFAIGAYAKFMITRDGGKTWENSEFVINKNGENAEANADEDDPLPTDYHLNSIARSADGTFYIAAEAGSVFSSDDGGHTWNELASPYDGSFFGILPLGGKNLLVYGLRGHVFRSEDSGASWRQIPTGTTALLTDAIAKPDGTIVVTGMAGVILTSSDVGESFTLHQPNRIALTSVIMTADGTLVVGGERGPIHYKLSDLINTKP